MFRLTLQRRWVLFTVFLLAAAISRAAIVPAGTPWTSRTDFEANRIASGFFLNNFNGETTGDTDETSLPYSGGSPTFSYTIFTAEGGNTLWVVNPVPDPDGNLKALSTNVEETALRIDFTSGNVTAVGANFFLSDFGDSRVSGTFDITLTFSDSSSETFNNIGSTTTGSLPFRGFTTDGSVFITSLVFTPDSDLGGTQQAATLDNLSVGITAVPEASHTGLVAALFLVVCSLGHIFRRKQAASKLSEVVS